MSIKQKLFASFGFIILILIGVAAFSVFQLSKTDNNYSFLIDDRAYKVIEASKIQNATSLQGLYIRSYVLRQNPSDLESLTEQREIVAQTLSEIAPLFDVEQMQKEINNVKGQQSSYNSYVDKIIEAVNNNQLAKANSILFK